MAPTKAPAAAVGAAVPLTPVGAYGHLRADDDGDEDDDVEEAGGLPEIHRERTRRHDNGKTRAWRLGSHADGTARLNTCFLAGDLVLCECSWRAALVL